MQVRSAVLVGLFLLCAGLVCGRTMPRVGRRRSKKPVEGSGWLTEAATPSPPAGSAVGTPAPCSNPNTPCETPPPASPLFESKLAYTWDPSDPSIFKRPSRGPDVWPPRDTAAASHRFLGECKTVGMSFDTPTKTQAALKFLGAIQQSTVPWRHAHAGSCAAWRMSGDWHDRGRQVYWGTLFAGEYEALTVLLEELWPVVDVFILVEARWTLQGLPKPLFWPAVANREFKRYASKVRWIEYDFASAGHRCDPTGKPPGSLRNSVDCRWAHQHLSRQAVAEGARDMRRHDLFLHSDLDEMPAREAVWAMRNCDVSPEGQATDKPRCGKVMLGGLGHKYDFGCGRVGTANVAIATGVLGRCLAAVSGPHFLRGAGGGNRRDWTWFAQQWGVPASAKVDPAELLPTQHVPSAGWHLHAFHDGDVGVLWKVFSRSGTSQQGWTPQEMGEVMRSRRDCLMTDLKTDGGAGSRNRSMERYFRMHPTPECWPLPHPIRENPVAWRHFISWQPDENWPDPFGTMEWKRRDLEQFKGLV